MMKTYEPETRQKVSQDLMFLLSNTFTLYLKTWNFHWNLIDPRFSSLHEFFEGQYKELAEQVDEIAERIRMLGEKVPATQKNFLELTDVKEAPKDLSGDDMIKDLAVDHQTLSKWLDGKVKETQELGDEGTADLYIKFLQAHDKQAWMLSSHLSRR
jgi:starvation-inducible DNA-binding protein